MVNVYVCDESDEAPNLLRIGNILAGRAAGRVGGRVGCLALVSSTSVLQDSSSSYFFWGDFFVFQIVKPKIFNAFTRPGCVNDLRRTSTDDSNPPLLEAAAA